MRKRMDVVHPSWSASALRVRTQMELAMPKSNTNLSTIETSLSEDATKIRALSERITSNFVEIGRMLAKCRSKFGRGKNPQFLKWAEDEFGWGQTSIYKFINA